MKRIRKTDSETGYYHYLYLMSKAFLGIMEQEVKDFSEKNNLSTIEYQILKIVDVTKQITVTDLSRLGTMHVSTAMNNVKKLAKRGYVSLEKYQQDGRVTYVHLTSAGEDLLAVLNESFGFEKQEMTQLMNVIPDKKEGQKLFAEMQLIVQEYYESPLLVELERFHAS